MTFGPLDFGRWVLAELVVRRAEPMAWGLPQSPPKPQTRSRSENRGGDSIWAETQPFWHE